MEELIDALEQLKDSISKEKVVVDYLKEKEHVFGNTEIITKIEKYRQYPSEELKKEIETSPSFLAYKEKERDVNLLIFGINQRFKTLRNQSDFGCRKEKYREDY